MRFRSLAALAVLLLSWPLLAQEDRYSLEQVVVVSRHNVRAPLQKNIDSARSNIEKPECLMEFSDPGSNLTRRGSALEIMMGGYFREWLKKEGLLVDQLGPGKDIVPSTAGYYFGASPRERTVASARAFAAGLMPSVAARVHFSPLGTADPDYLPFLVDSGMIGGAPVMRYFQQVALKQKEVLVSKWREELREAYKLLDKAVGLKMDQVDTSQILVNFAFFQSDGNRKEPTAEGGLLKANQIADHLILQYYESPDPCHPAPGVELKIDSFAEWRRISLIKDIYSELLFTEPIVAVNVSHGLLQQVKCGTCEDRVFTLLCTHDTSISALLTALRIAPYTLPADTAVEHLTPIGCKVVLEKYRKGDAYYGKIRMIYPHVHLLTVRHEEGEEEKWADLEKGIVSVDLDFEGLSRTGDGYYRWEDVIRRMDETLAEFELVLLL